MAVQFVSAYSIGERVYLDRGDLTGAVTAIVFRCRYQPDLTPYPLYEVSWFNNGVLQTAWFEEWRLSLTQQPKEQQ